MARISGIDLNDDWRLIYALTQIKGIGWSRSEEILKDLKIKESTRMSDLSTEEITKLNKKIDGYLTEGDLQRRVREDVQRLKVIGSYRGMRHNQGLPVRGQRTKSNARTKRGSRKTVGAFRKEALAKQQQNKKTDEE